MNCKNCHKKCQAACCGVCPIPKDIFERNKEKIISNPCEILEVNGPDIADDLGETTINELKERKGKDFIIPITKNMKCCFLNEDLSCNIYQDRPNICKKFGDESHLFMTCLFQDKNGKIRSRQESRKIERQLLKYSEVTNKDPKKLLNILKS